MMHGKFERPTAHYDERLEEIDTEICALVKQRKEISSNNPGFPTDELISTWAKEYHFYEEFLNGLFGHLLAEDMYKPAVEPKGFLKNIPVLQSFEKEDLFYTVTSVRQYKNASVVWLTIDWDDSEDIPGEFVDHDFFELSIASNKGTDYSCQNRSGGGPGGHMAYQYIISPPLPDDLSSIKFIFNEGKTPFSEATGVEFVIEID